MIQCGIILKTNMYVQPILSIALVVYRLVYPLPYHLKIKMTLLDT